MFRGKTFQVTLPGNSYRIFIEGLKSPVTKAAYSYALQKYMTHLNTSNPDDLLNHQENPKIIQNQIVEYLIQLKNPPHLLRYATRSQYLAAIMTFYELNDIPLSKKKIYRYLGEEERPIDLIYCIPFHCLQLFRRFNATSFLSNFILYFMSVFIVLNYHSASSFFSFQYS
jgi:hypothetical protein